MSPPRFAIACSMEALDPWRDQWDALADNHGLPLARYAWFSAAERHLAGTDQVRVVYGLDADGRLAGAAAFEQRFDAHGRSNYQILGLPRLFEPSALLYRDSHWMRALLGAVTALRKPVILGRLWTEDADTCADRTCRLDRRAVWLSKESTPSQYLSFRGSYSDYIGSLPGQRRYDLRRAYRRAESAETLNAEFRRPTPSELEPLLALAMDIEARSWKGQARSALLANPDLQGFFRDVLESYAAAGSVMMAFLRLGARTIATQICLLGHGRLWLLKIGYDPAYHKLSPGLIMMNESIRFSYNHGLRGLEFLGCAEEWVEAWKPSLRHYRLLAAYPYNTASLLCLGMDAATRVFRSLRNSGPGQQNLIDA